MRTLVANRPVSRDAAELLDGARAALTALGNPLIRYDWERCNAHLEELKVACGDLSRLQGERRWAGMTAAVENADKWLLEFHYDLSKFQHLVNMPERIRWLNAEFGAARGEDVPREELSKFRHWFTEKGGALNLWQEQAIKAGQLIRVGMFRKDIRELRSRLSLYEDRCDAVQDAGAPGVFHQWVADAHLWILTARGSLRETQRVVSAGDELKEPLDRYTALSYDFNMAIGRSKDPKGDFKRFLTEAKAIVAGIESESRIVFADQLDLTMLRNRQLGVEILEQTGTPKPETVKEIRSMMKEWLIDYRKKEPQRGFGRVYSRNEIRDFMEKHDGRLFTVKLDGAAVGHYIIFVNREKFPPHVKEALKAVADSGDYMAAITGWAEMVGLTRAGREIAHARGLNLYTLVHEAAKDTFASFQVEKVYGAVREGTYANLSKPDHLKREWDETGVIVEYGMKRKMPYQVLRMVLSPAGMWGAYGGG